MKNKLKLAFSDMWGFEDYLFNPHDNYFLDLFKTKFDVEINQNNPDLLIYSVFGNNYKNFDCKKILFSGENRGAPKTTTPHYNDSDITLSHYNDEGKEILVPLWVLSVNWFQKKQPRPLPSNPTYCVDLNLIQHKRERFLKRGGHRKFCALINNAPSEDRILLFKNLNKHAHIDSFGSLLNNTGKPLRGSQQDKIDVLHNYKFTVAFENSYHYGYNTEKIIEPLEAGCIPLYNGGECVKKYFNSKSFLYYKDYPSMDSYIEEILKIAQDQDFYESVVLEPPLNLNKIEKDLCPAIILNKILKILDL